MSAPLRVLFPNPQHSFKLDELGLEIMRIAFPAALALLADPIASLIDTGFVGHIGPVELAAVGVSIAVFNQVSRIAIFPLVSVTTSFVAEEDAASKDENVDGENSENQGSFLEEGEMEELVPQTGFPYDGTGISVLDTAVSWCSSCSLIFGYARCFSRIQGHNNSSLCYW